MNLKHVVAISIFVVVQSFLSGPVLAENQLKIPIYIKDKKVGNITSLSFLQSKNEKFMMEINAILESFPENLDEILMKEGNLTGKCPYRLFWRGKTSIRDGGRDNLYLSSRLGYELYVCVPKKKLFGKIPLPTDKLTFKHLSDARMVDWTLFINPARIDELNVSAKLKNIQGIPDGLEKILGLHVTEHIAVKIPDLCGTCKCSDVIKETQLSLEKSAFSFENDRDVQVSAIFSAQNDLGGILRCMDDFKF